MSAICMFSTKFVMNLKEDSSWQGFTSDKWSTRKELWKRKRKVRQLILNWSSQSAYNTLPIQNLRRESWRIGICLWIVLREGYFRISRQKRQSRKTNKRRKRLQIMCTSLKLSRIPEWCTSGCLNWAAISQFLWSAKPILQKNFLKLD